MVHSCCAINCTERAEKGSRVTFHSFPKEESRRKLWLNKIRRVNFEAKSSKVCSKHFTPDSFDREKFGGTWLKKDAVPTLFDFPKHLQKVVSRRKQPAIRKNETSVLTPNESKKRKHYFGDFTESDMESSTKAKKILHICEEHSKDNVQKLKHLKQECQRMEKRICYLTQILRTTQKKTLISQSAKDILEASEKQRIKNILGGNEPRLIVKSETNLLTTTEKPLNMTIEVDPTTLISSAPGPSTRIEPDSFMIEQDVHLAMTCDLYPANELHSASLIKIKEEPMDPCKQDILPACLTQELTHVSKEPSSTSNQESSYFQPPVLIKEEPISFEEEL